MINHHDPKIPYMPHGATTGKIGESNASVNRAVAMVMVDQNDNLNGINDDDDTLRRLWHGDSDRSSSQQIDESFAFANPCHHRDSHGNNAANDNDKTDDDHQTSPSTATTTTTISNNETPLPPPYLMTATLAGLYELPPPHILRYQTGWGRRIRYRQVHHIPTNFQNLQYTNDLHHTGPTIQYMTLQRYSQFQFLETPTHTTTQNVQSMRKRATQCHEFNIYRVQLLDSSGCDNDHSHDTTTTKAVTQNATIRHMNEQLQQLAYREIQQDATGLNVSNAGGTYHGLPNFFRNIHVNDDATTTATAASGDDGKLALYHYIRNVMERIEHYESSLQQEQQSLDPTSLEPSNSSCSTILSTCRRLTTPLALESQDIECWVNISETNGSWNRLHTHEGSAYSGVYYVSSSSSTLDTITNDWNGNFIVKPTPHPLEDTYTLSSHEQSRLRRNDNGAQHPLPYIDEVQYVMIPPIPGTMILFPSYIHHCVLPLEVVADTDDTIQDTHGRRRRHHPHPTNDYHHHHHNHDQQYFHCIQYQLETATMSAGGINVTPRPCWYRSDKKNDVHLYQYVPSVT